ncbi:MAG: 3-hydroxyacyl-CoA dehydrogenase NAD-binding domain-containing protein [Bdellovibrionaceae bacterium]|nr:3-hydroxyacyl-CoA dehydrogenase NAD-binding domain-containing protein [Pseudobdellovibrionaceae bacterium]MDW8189634.1 3-hydroxyacyl-CoA dehydrogenase NAD-binding domain-containing protein [Pseudobdellovibrionaceae bacterium]
MKETIEMTQGKLGADLEKSVASMVDSIRIVPHQEIAIVELDQKDSKVNKWSTPMMMRLRQVIEELKKSSYQGVVFISRKPKIFVAGADIDEIRDLKTKEEFSRAVAEGQSIFNMIEDLPMVTVAAIHGAAAGGGCEFALACDYRIATEDGSTRIGLPEVKLGIIPGFGGCVRLPKVVGLQAALDIILQGKLLAAKKAGKVGLVDLVVHENLLEKYALDFVREKKGQKRPVAYRSRGLVNQFLDSWLGAKIVFQQAQKSVLKATKGHYPAPLKALEVIRKTYGMADRERALAIEREGFCEVAVTQISKNLIHVFDLTEMVKKQTGVEGVTVEPKAVRHISVLGAGTMGGGIAYVAADRGIEVRLKDINLVALAKGVQHARNLWEKLLNKKVIDQYEFQQKMARVSGGTDYSDFKRTDLVVEAIVEDMEIKKKVIHELSHHIRPETIVVTNTSSLSVTEMAKAFPRPELFAGMHFFNPVDKMPLVEVIRGEKTSDVTVATVFDLAKKMGKMPVVVKDGPGFFVNRLLLPYMAEAAFLLQEGQDIERVDRAYEYGFGMPMGPFALMDEVGLDVCLKVLKIFKKSFPDRIEMAPFLEKLEGLKDRLGRKTKLGFYLYDYKGYREKVDPQIYSVLGLNPPRNPLSDEDCVDRGVYAMINEAARALWTDRIVASAAEADLAMIMGTGFPPFRGGLLKFADQIGLEHIIGRLEEFGRTYARLRVSSELREVNKQGGFYKAFPKKGLH